MLSVLLLTIVTTPKLSPVALNFLLLKAERHGIVSRGIEVFPSEHGLSLISYSDGTSWSQRSPIFRCEISTRELKVATPSPLKEQAHIAFLASYRHLAAKNLYFENGLIAHIYDESTKHTSLSFTSRPRGRNIFYLTLNKSLIVKKLHVRRSPPG